jgi:Fe-S-cluster formation regulator IscX/YfhJ
MDNWKSYDSERFGDGVQQNFTAMQKQVCDLETFFDIHPFPKHKHSIIIIHQNHKQNDNN